MMVFATFFSLSAAITSYLIEITYEEYKYLKAVGFFLTEFFLVYLGLAAAEIFYKDFYFIKTIKGLMEKRSWKRAWNRLWKKKDDSHDQAEKFFKIGINLSDKVKSKLQKIKLTNSPENSVLYFFHLKSRKTYQAIILLWKKGFTEDAFILSRTLLELSLQARYIETDPILLAKRFINFDPVQRWKHYEKYTKNSGLTLGGQKDINSKRLQDLKNAHDEAMKKFGYKGQYWWGGSIEWLAKKLGNGTDPIYFGLYPIQSGYVHSDARSSKEYIKIKEYEDEYNADPGIRNSIVLPVEATRSLILIANAVSSICHLDLDQDIESAVEEIRKLSGMEST